ncbi:hypothetical protein Slin14017_G109330 [Septoria linicola]|nr:hypothetical protein Slin14017_G109330 [Septoria linicola]
MSSFTPCICRNVKTDDLVLITLPSHASPSGHTHLLYRVQLITVQHNIEFCNEVHATLLLRNAWDDILDFGVLAETPHLGETIDLSDIIRHIGNGNVTLRPTMSHLSHIARPDRRSCRFCENGTVPVDPSNPTHTPRSAITQNGRPILTICRHCMGQEFFTEHERRIAGLNHAYLHPHVTRGPYRLHLNFIDARRIALGYGALPQYTHIDTLQNGVQWPPDVLPLPPPPPPPLPESTIVYACYLKAKGCQKAHWKSHKKECSRLASTRDTPASSGGSSSAPFTAIFKGNFLHDRPEDETYKLLVDILRMRQEDMYTHQGDTMPGTIYNGSSSSETAFRLMLRRAKQINDFLPAWWSDEKEEACVSTHREDLTAAQEKSDIQETWNDPTMPMKLRFLGEKIWGSTPGARGASTGRSMLEFQMSLEGGNSNMVTSHLDFGSTFSRRR